MSAASTAAARVQLVAMILVVIHAESVLLFGGDVVIAHFQLRRCGEFPKQKHQLLCGRPRVGYKYDCHYLGTLGISFDSF